MYLRKYKIIYFVIKHESSKSNKVADCLYRENIINIIDAVISEHYTISDNKNII